MSQDLERYDALRDSEAAGVELDAEAKAFCEQMEREHPELAEERRAWEGMMAELRASGPGAQELDALAESALDRHRAEARRRGRTRNLVAVGGLAAAASLALWFSGALDQDSETAVAEAAVDSPAAPTRQSPPPAPVSPSESVAPLGPTPEVGAVQPPVLALAGVGLDWGEVGTGVSLREGRSASAEACVRWQDPFAVVCVERGTNVRATEDASGRELVIERGNLRAVLDTVPEGQSFRVRTPRGSVSAVGTAFEVDVDESGSARLHVTEGRVRIEEGDNERFLGAGAGAELGVPGETLIEASTQERGEALAQAAASWRADDTGVLDVPADLDAKLDGAALPVVAHTRMVAAGSHRVQVGDRATTLEVGVGESHRLEAPARGSATTPRVPSAAVLAERAQARRRAKDYEGTVDLYRQLLRHHPDSALARNVPVRLGDLLLGELGDPKGALGAYERYLKKGGPLAPEARYGRIRALRALRRPAKERKAIEDFLAAHPDDWRGEALRSRLDHL